MKCCNCVKEIPDDSQFCNYCGIEQKHETLKNEEEDNIKNNEIIAENNINETKSHSLNNKKEFFEKISSFLKKHQLLYSLLIIAICILPFWLMFRGEDFSSKNRERDAWVCAEDVVKQRLKSPSSAKFCTYPEASIENEGDEYKITGWVDADNSFGTSIRKKFTVTLTLTESGYKNAYCYIE